jgi:hypothetical protein
MAGAEADQLHPSSAKVLRSGAYLHSYAFMACTGTALALDYIRLIIGFKPLQSPVPMHLGSFSFTWMYMTQNSSHALKKFVGKFDSQNNTDTVKV